MATDMYTVNAESASGGDGSILPDGVDLTGTGGIGDYGNSGGGPKKPPEGKDPDQSDPWTSTQQNAFDFLVSTFAALGLDMDGTGLAAEIKRMLIEGLGNDSITLQLQQTQAYRDRFSGNEIRRQKGLPVLSPAEYLAQEAAYRQALSYYGLPKGFYDDPSDFADWIGKDVSAVEIRDRAAIAAEMGSELMSSLDPAMKNTLAEYYGIGPGEITAYYLDQKRALPVIEAQTRSVQIGAAAARNGLQVARDRAEDLAAYGISREQAQSGYAAIGQSFDPLKALAAIDRTDLSLTDVEDAYLKQTKPGLDKVKKLASNERARFSGGSGVNRASLSQGSSGAY